jgi:hypothetical protein
VLRKADVKVVVDLPGVGNNVQEHMNTGMAYRTPSHLELFPLDAEDLSRSEGRVRSGLQVIRLLEGSRRTSEANGALVSDPTTPYFSVCRKGSPSHAGESTIFDTAGNLLAFVPLSAISPEAQAIQDKYLASIRARIDSGSCPPGLRKQYELQLEYIKDKIPSCEVMLVPGFSFFRRKYQRALLIPVCLPPCRKSCPGSQQEICGYRVSDESPSISWFHCARLYLSSPSVNTYARPYFEAH